MPSLEEFLAAIGEEVHDAEEGIAYLILLLPQVSACRSLWRTPMVLVHVKVPCRVQPVWAVKAKTPLAAYISSCLTIALYWLIYSVLIDLID